MLIYANPSKPSTAKKKRKKSTQAPKKRAATKEAPMARTKKRRRAASKRRRVTVHKNPTVHKRTRKRAHGLFAKRRRHRNPSSFAGKGILSELLSKDGLMLIGGGVAGLLAPSAVTLMVMPTATGATKFAIKAAVGVGGAWAISKVNKKAAIGFAVGALAGLISPIVTTYMETGQFTLGDDDGVQNYGMTPSMLGSYGQQALGAYGEQALGAYGEQALGGIGMGPDLGDESYAN